MQENSLLTAPIAAPPGGAIVADPFLFRLRDLIYQTSGILFTENKFYYLSDRCTRRMEARGVPSLALYLDLLQSAGGVEAENELRALLNEITVGETCFFRNQPQIDALRSTVLPAVAEEKAKFGYKLRNIPAHYKQKYMRPVTDGFQVNDDVKSLVKFNRLNLRDDSRMVFMKGLDVVFCCNVLIYFGAQPKRRVIQHFYNDLLPGGYLFLGHSESLFGLNDEFKLVHFPQATAYRKPPRSLL